MYVIPRKHTAELNGGSVKFYTLHRFGSFSFRGDAIQACKDAGLYHDSKDADRILVDGYSIARED